MRDRLLVSGAIGLAVFIGVLVLFVLSEFLGTEVVGLATLFAFGVATVVFLIDLITENK